MINRPRGFWLTRVCGDDELNRALTGKGSGGNHQLHAVGSPDIGDKAGIRRTGILQDRLTAAGSGNEGPVEA